MNNNLLHEVEAERTRQDEKWGASRKLRSELWATILGEEYGEACKAVLEVDAVNLREELMQVAAVALAWIESLDEYGTT